MSKRLTALLRRGIVALATLIGLLVVTTYIVIGTESGTRWIIGKAASFAAVNIDSERVSGTLLTELRIPLIHYADPQRTLAIEGLALNIDWSRTSLNVVSLEQVAVARAVLQNIGEPDPAPTPFGISMPALPIEIAADSVSIATLFLDDNTVSYVSVTGIRGWEKSIAVKHAAAIVDDLSVEVRNSLIEIDGSVPVGGEIGWRLSESPWSGTATVGGTLARLEVQHALTGDYPAMTDGSIELLGKLQPVVDLTTRFDVWHYQDWSSDHGVFRVTGTIDQYRADFTAAIATDSVPGANISGNASGDVRGLRSLDVTAITELGRARATGNVAWSPETAVDLLLVADNIDLSNLLSLPAKDVTAEVKIKATDPSQFTIEVISLTGIWNGHRSAGSGRVQRQANAWTCGNCRLRVGDNHINIDGLLDDLAITGAIDIDAPMLQQLWSDLSGSFTVNGNVKGTVALPVLSGSASGNELRFADWQVDFLSVQTQSSTLDVVDIDVEFRQLVHADSELGGARIRVAGRTDALDVVAEWTLGSYAATATALLAAGGDTIDGHIKSARLTEPFTGDWNSSTPISFHVEPGSVLIGNALWTNDDAYLKHDSLRIGNDMLKVDGEIGGLPLSLFNAAMPADLQVDGLVDATIAVVNDAGGWSGLVDWQQRETRLTFPSSQEDFTLIMPVARATLRLDDNAAVLQAEINAEPGLAATLDFSSDDLSVTAPLDAHLRFSGDDWEWVTTLIPDIDNIEGSVSADITATGSIESPILSGQARWQKGRLDIPVLNLPLDDIEVTLTGTSAGDMTVDGKAVTGGGTLGVDGRLKNITSASPSIDIRLTGDRAGLLNWPDYRATASPDLAITGDTRGAKLSGRVSVDSANITIEELPKGAVRPSQDVTVVGREEDVREATRISGDVDVVLGESFHLQAFGLDTDLEGEMRFILREDREPQGRGEVRLVDGFFEAYGQRLEIEQGTMIFNGPLDDPLINIRATRRVESIDGTVVAGINLSGRAQELNSSIYSEPAMSEADALSYLVLGRPLEDASADEGNNLADSAYSLGLRQAALITNQIGQTVGIDELTIGGSNQNTTELVAGKQLNSRLHARYAYGVFTRLGKLLLRYRLSDSFSVELGAGENQSMDLLYTIEKE